MPFTNYSNATKDISTHGTLGSVARGYKLFVLGTVMEIFIFIIFGMFFRPITAFFLRNRNKIYCTAIACLIIITLFKIFDDKTFLKFLVTTVYVTTLCRLVYFTALPGYYNNILPIAVYTVLCVHLVYMAHVTWGVDYVIIPLAMICGYCIFHLMDL